MYTDVPTINELKLQEINAPVYVVVPSTYCSADVLFCSTD